MPLYEYECQACGYRMEEYQSFHAEPLQKCPQCEKDELVRLISGGLAVIIPKCTTIGSLAEQNTREARKAGVGIPKSCRRLKNPKFKPFWRDEETVNKKILENPDKYIQTGKV